MRKQNITFFQLSISLASAQHNRRPGPYNNDKCSQNLLDHSSESGMKKVYSPLAFTPWLRSIIQRKYFTKVVCESLSGPGHGAFSSQTTAAMLTATAVRDVATFARERILIISDLLRSAHSCCGFSDLGTRRPVRRLGNY